MKIAHTNTRMQRYMLPGIPTRCSLARDCVYRVAGVCDEPKVNKGNSDAACYGMSNKDIADRLEPLSD